MAVAYFGNEISLLFQLGRRRFMQLLKCVVAGDVDAETVRFLLSYTALEFGQVSAHLSDEYTPTRFDNFSGKPVFIVFVFNVKNRKPHCRRRVY